MRNLTNATVTEFTADSAVQMVSLATGELHGKAPVDLFGAVEQHPTFGDFPATGKENVLYVDQSKDPYQGYVWHNGAYEQLGGQNLDVVVAPIGYVPTATGNTANLNQVVVDPNGDIWVIDYQGDAALLELAKHLGVLLTVQPTPAPSGNNTNLATIFKDARGMTWVIDRKGDAIATGAPETVYYYGVDSETFPANPFTGDELLVTDTGDATGKILEQWLFDGANWVKRPFTEPIPMAGALLAAMACIGSPVLVPTGNTQDVQTVGVGGDHADLQAALASASVVDGTILRLTGDQVLSATLNVNKAVVIDLAGFKVDSTTAGPVTMFNMTAPLSVVKGGTINHLKTTNTSVESVFSLASTDATKPVFVTDNTINVMEFGVTARGNYVVADNTFGYIGASQTNSHRYFGLYGNSGESRITGNKFTAITATTTRYTNFILMTSTTGTVYGGKLYVDNNTQTGGSLRQFFFHEAGAAEGMELYVGNNTFDDLNGGIGIQSPALYNSYSKIGIFNNTQGGSAVGNFKGVFFVDGSGVLSDDVALTYGGNTTAAGPLRADYVSLDADSENLIAVKNTITFTEQKTAPVVDEENLEALGELLQDLKGRKTYIVDSEGQPIQGNGTEADPFVVAAKEQWTNETVTTSLTPVVYDGGWTGAQADIEGNLAKEIRLSDGTILSSGLVTWTDHGLTVGETYYTSQTTAGAYVTPEPASGLSQALFTVIDANTIDIQVQEGVQIVNDIGTAPTDFAKTVYVNTADPNTATSFYLDPAAPANDNTLKSDSQNIYFGSDGSTWTWGGTAYKTYQFPQTVKVGFFAHMKPTMSVPNATDVVVTNLTTINNTAGGAWDAATGKFTAPRAGWYTATAAMMLAPGNWNVDTLGEIRIRRNGVDIARGLQWADKAKSNFYIDGATVTIPVYLNTGDVLNSLIWQNSGSAKFPHFGTSNYFGVLEN